MAEKRLSGPHEIAHTDVQGYSMRDDGLDDKSRSLTHHTYYNPKTNRRISYDTYEAAWGEEYIDGSGHEVDQDTNQIVRRW
jgi:hypothetical protein